MIFKMEEKKFLQIVQWLDIIHSTLKLTSQKIKLVIQLPNLCPKK
jgi:hypothetical protein